MTENKIPVFPEKTRVKIDVAKYDGVKAKLAIVEIIDTFTSYTEASYSDKGEYIQGKWVDGLRRPIKKLKVATDILETIPRENNTPIEIRASRLFGLSKRKQLAADGTSTEIWGVSQNSNSKLFQFMRRQKVTTVEELKGTQVLVTIQPSEEEDGPEYLTFVI